MRATFWVLGIVLTAGFVGMADNGSIAWPSESAASVSSWKTQACPALHHEGLVHPTNDDFFYTCYFIGCACESNILACCTQICCHWTCWFLPSWMCSCYYRTWWYWVPNCYTSPVLPMKVEPVGEEL